MYNMTSIENTTNLYSFTEAINTLTNGTFSVFLLVSTFILILIVLKKWDTRDVLVVDSFVTSLIAMLLFTMGWIGLNILIYPFVALIGSVILRIWKDD